MTAMEIFIQKQSLFAETVRFMQNDEAPEKRDDLFALW
jgi:hypothetical protein